MPIHTISIAGVLNGISDRYANTHGGTRSFVKFTAPDAKILIVDDIRTNLKVAEGLLMPYQVQTHTCLSGAAAVDLVKANQTNQSNQYDIIMMDHFMPGMDGLETTAMIRSLESGSGCFRNIPIIALTANAVSGVKDMFLQNGFNGFISKPIDTAELNAVLEKWIPKEKQKSSMGRSSRAITPNMSNERDNSIDILIDGVDVGLGISRTSGKAERYLETLDLFCEDIHDNIIKIKACLDEGTISLYTTYVHAIKSAAANIGAIDLSNMAQELENAGIRGDMNYIAMHNEKFLTDLDTLLYHIGNTLSLKKAGKEDKHDININMEQCKALLITLNTALEDMDAGTIKSSLNSLKKLAGSNNNTGRIVGEISKNILVGEYGTAVLLIESLLRRI
jgi:CheY-like chemotaxis protein